MHVKNTYKFTDVPGTAIWSPQERKKYMGVQNGNAAQNWEWRGIWSLETNITKRQNRYVPDTGNPQWQIKWGKRHKNKNNDTVKKAPFTTHKSVQNVVQVDDDGHIDVPAPVNVPFDRANVDVPNVMAHVTVVSAQSKVLVITAQFDGPLVPAQLNIPVLPAQFDEGECTVLYIPMLIAVSNVTGYSEHNLFVRYSRTNKIKITFSIRLVPVWNGLCQTTTDRYSEYFV